MNMHTTPKEREPLGSVLTRLVSGGHRLLFLSAGLLAFCGIAIWFIWLAVHALDGVFTSSFSAQAPYLWHAHEMVFAYATAVLAGFFLTAVPNWTATKPPPSSVVCIIGGLWLAGRIAVWFSATFPAGLVMVADMALYVGLAVWLALRLRANPKPRNVVFIGLISLLGGANLMVHLDWMAVTTDTAVSGLHGGLLLICSIITIVGGRIVPAFTRNALIRENRQGESVTVRPVLDGVAIASVLVMAFLVLLDVDGRWIGPVAGLAALTNGLRLAGWQGWRMLHSPIVWSLHLAFSFLVFGYTALALSWSFDLLQEVAALHLLGIGAVGSMTVAVMTRATLGHTSRPLAVNGLIATAYLAIAASALVRAFGTVVFPEAYFAVMLSSAALWLVAYGLFLTVYLPIFLGPDGE